MRDRLSVRRSQNKEFNMLIIVLVELFSMYEECLTVRLSHARICVKCK